MTIPPIILASASPRRRDLLCQIGIEPMAIIPTDINETPNQRELPPRYALRMADEKARAIVLPDGIDDGAVVLAGDTVVAVGRRILPKAETEDQARSCLALLSGRRHRVYGGIAADVLLAGKVSFAMGGVFPETHGLIAVLPVAFWPRRWCFCPRYY